ncbi:MAG: hypothetical protein Q8865_10680 [Bacillota bacterium]|nr:hypothetical protein [Bacillota bacterium]
MSISSQYEKINSYNQNRSEYSYPQYRYSPNDDLRDYRDSSVDVVATPAKSQQPPQDLMQNQNLSDNTQVSPGTSELPGAGEISGMPGVPSVFDPGFLQSYLLKNIGKRVRVEYLIGTNILTDRVGVIEDVGYSYLVLRDQSGSRLLSDLYSIKFVTFYE